METKTHSKVSNTASKTTNTKVNQTDSTKKTPWGFYLMMGGLAAMIIYLIVLVLTI